MPQSEPSSLATPTDAAPILLIKVNPTLRKGLRDALECAGHRVVEANDGASALRFIAQTRPSLVIHDLVLPDMDGIVLAGRLRDQLTGAHVPILCVSGFLSGLDESCAIEGGCDQVLIKPVDPRHLVAVVNFYLATAAAPSPNEDLLARSALQEARIAVLGIAAESLAKHRVLNGVLGDALAACLDMAGISKGALYTIGADNCLTLKHQVGFSDAETPQLHRSFGCAKLFSQLAERGQVVPIPSASVPDDVATQLLRDIGATSILFVPVIWAGTSYGVLLLATRTAKITSNDALAFARVLGTQMGQAIGLAKSFTNLAASEQRYRTLTENANDAICILTADGGIREVNRRMTEILGYSVAEMVGRHVGEFDAPGRGRENAQAFRALVASGGGPAHTFELQRRDGAVVMVEFSTAAVDLDGEQLVFSIGRDVTDQMREHAQLMVSDRMASVGTLAAGVAHEINNPLAAVLANLDLAVQDTALLVSDVGAVPAVVAIQESLRDAREATDRVRQIVKDLKLFSRAEEEKRGPVDIGRVMESALRMAWNEIRHRARLVKQYGKVPAVDANESRLGQLFLNLVVNAAQSIEEGQADAHQITVTTRTDDRGQVVIEIADTGPGIPADVLPNIFKPFFTTKPAGIGTGLGLAICQRIVTELQGEISVESTVGAGTTFRIVLPASRVQWTEEAPVRPVRPAGRRGRILLIDDDPMIGSAVRRALAAEHEVLSLTKAGDALERIRTGERFDVILCDLMMPFVTGVEFYEQLVQLAPEQAERIVFLTGGAFTATARTFLDEVPNARMEKPFELQNLRALVNDRIGARKRVSSPRRAAGSLA